MKVIRDDGTEMKWPAVKMLCFSLLCGMIGNLLPPLFFWVFAALLMLIFVLLWQDARDEKKGL